MWRYWKQINCTCLFGFFSLRWGEDFIMRRNCKQPSIISIAVKVFVSFNYAVFYFSSLSWAHIMFALNEQLVFSFSITHTVARWPATDYRSTPSLGDPAAARFCFCCFLGPLTALFTINKGGGVGSCLRACVGIVGTLLLGSTGGLRKYNAAQLKGTLLCAIELPIRRHSFIGFWFSFFFGECATPDDCARWLRHANEFMIRGQTMIEILCPVLMLFFSSILEQFWS